MTDETNMPPTVKVRAIDAKPYHWAMRCTIGDDPRIIDNEICARKWSEDGRHIWFMLDTHNFVKAAPDEELDLVPRTPGFSIEYLASVDDRDDVKMATRPRHPNCETCGRPTPDACLATGSDSDE